MDFDTFISGPDIPSLSNTAISKAREARERLLKAQNEIIIDDDDDVDDEEKEEDEIEVVEDPPPTTTTTQEDDDKQVNGEEKVYGGSSLTLKIRVNGNNKTVLSYPTTSLAPFSKIASWLADEYKCQMEDVKVKLDGDVVHGMGTPDGEDLEDDDILDAKVPLLPEGVVGGGPGGTGVVEKKPVIIEVIRNGLKRQRKKFKILNTDRFSKIAVGFRSHYTKGKYPVVLYLKKKPVGENDTPVGVGWKGEVLEGMDNGKVPKV